jgi:hypothetical protein
MSVPAAASCAASFLQVVAHQDDDLLFMNPDVATSIRQGCRTQTVYLTAGEYVGVREGEYPGRPARTREEYASDREHGVRAAYALMAAVTNSWQRSTVAVNGHAVEIDRLVGAEHVSLVFLCLREDGDDLAAGTTLADMWRDPAVTGRTILPTGTLVRHTQSYTRGGLLATLASLMQMFKPTAIRVQDTSPTIRWLGRDGNPDHLDHVYAARFGTEAAKSYHGPDGRGGFTLVGYRDYNACSAPPNLPGAQTRDKQRTLDTYAAYDPHYYPPMNAHSGRLYLRWPAGATWSGRAKDGRLAAFAMRDSMPHMWFEDASGAWRGPLAIGGGLLASRLTVVSDADGRLQVFGRDPESARIVAAGVAASGGPLTGWVSVGNLGSAGDVSSDAGQPAAARDGGGRIHLFVANVGGGLSAAHQEPANGTFTGWTDLGGDTVQEPPSVVTTRDGRLEVFANATRGIAHWYQSAPGAAFRYDARFPPPDHGDARAAPTRAPASAPTAVVDHEGRIEIFYREPATGDVMRVRQDSPNGGWSTPAQRLAAPAGLGEPAAVLAADGRLLLAARTSAGTVTYTFQGAPGGAFLPWTELGGPRIEQALTMQLDRDNNATLMAIGSDGRMHANRQAGPAATEPFLGWQAT